MEYKDYYQIMGLKRDASQDEIKRAYRKLARKYHPDVSQEADAEQRFKELGEAYEVLKDPEKRAAYDQLGANWKSGQEFRPPPDWAQGFEFHTEGFAPGDHFSDFFESLFGQGGLGGGFGRSHRTGNLRGEDSYARILIDLEDAYHGATRTLVLRHPELNAQGQTQLKERTLNVRIPRGVRQGQHIRLAKQGGAGHNRGEAGDLYLEVEFRSHPDFHVEGKDVFLDLPVTPWEAALGATINVPTPAGAVDLKIPPNSANGRKLRLKGRGIPSKEPGDLYVVLQVKLPPANSDLHKAAYSQFAKAFQFNPRHDLGRKRA